MIASAGYNWAHAWPYVGTGYVLAAATLGGYAAWVLRKLRRADQSFAPTDDEAPAR